MQEFCIHLLLINNDIVLFESFKFKINVTEKTPASGNTKRC